MALLLAGCGQLVSGPRLPALPDSRTTIGEPLQIPFEVGHGAPETVRVSASSSDEALVPGGNLVIQGTGIERILEVTPADGAEGTAVISVTAVDSDDRSEEVSFTLTVDRPFEAPTTITADEAQDGSDYGRTVAVSGNFVFVAAEYDDAIGVNSGAVYVYELTTGGWRFEGRLTPSTIYSGQRFGRAIDAAGDTLVVGASHDDSSGNSAGAAYVFQLTGEGWSEQAKLVASDAGEAAYFGSGVGVDGDHIIVGAPGDDELAVGSGAVYLFERRGGGWSQVEKLVRSDGGYFDRFGSWVDISGSWAVTVTFPNGSNGRAKGTAHLFRLEEGAWTEAAVLSGDEQLASDRFGLSLAMDQNRLAVADRETNTIYLFENDEAGWQLSGTVEASELKAGYVYGEDLALSGEYLAVSASGYDADDLVDTGAVYVYRRGRNGWYEVARVTGSRDGGYHKFAWAVGLDGELLVTSTESLGSTESAIAYRR